MMYDKVDTRPSSPPGGGEAPRWESIRIIVSRWAAALWPLQMLSAQLPDLLYVLYAPYAAPDKGEISRKLFLSRYLGRVWSYLDCLRFVNCTKM